MAHNQDSGRCNPTQDYLAEATHLRRPAVNGAIKQLHAGGWIGSTRTRGASYYVLNLTAGAEVSGEAEMSAKPDSLGSTGQAEMSADRYSRCPNSGHQMSANRYTELSTLTVQENHLSSSAGKPVRQQEKERGAFGRVERSKLPADTPLPDSFELTDERRAAAVAAGVAGDDIEAALADLRDHARETGRTCQDWDAAWSRWCRNRRKRPVQAQQPAMRGNPRFGTPLRPVQPVQPQRPGLSRFQMPLDDPRLRVAPRVQ